MFDRPATAQMILAAARRSILSSGRQKLTLSGVAAEAGVSRPTIYRWFPTKTMLLAEIAAYEVEQFDLGLQKLADEYPNSTTRLDAALRYLSTYLDGSMGADSIAADPTFALQSLADSLAPHVASLTRVLGDALDMVPAVRRKTVSRQQAAELILRVAYSQYLVPNADPEGLLNTLRGFAGLAREADTRTP